MIRPYFFSFPLIITSGLFIHTLHTFYTIPHNLPGNATSTAFHMKTRQWFIGSQATNDDDFVLHSILPETETLPHQFITFPISLPAEENMSLLALSDRSPYDSEKIRIVFTTTNAPSTLKKTSTIGHFSQLDNTIIRDANNAANNGIVGLAASSTHIFAAVKPNNGDWGQTHSGIAVISISNDDTSTLEYHSTIALDATVAQVNAGSQTHNPVLTNDAPALHWCEDLATLYVGIQGQSGADAAHDAIKVLSAYRLNGDTLESLGLVNLDHTTPLKDAGNTFSSSIIGANAANKDFSIIKIDSMKTSTGHYYLIIQGGLGTKIENPSRQILALPLVDADHPSKGTLAAMHMDTTWVSFRFNAPDMNFLFNEPFSAVKVGTGPLPVEAAEGVITQMIVVGDTVYCATQATPGAANEPGLYYSQAIFDQTGAISYWTAWAKAAPNEMSGITNDNGSCAFFAVDAITGKIVTIPHGSKQEVHVTVWEKSADTDTFVGSVNKILDGPCYSYVHYHQQTPKSSNFQKSRLAFFGGNSKMVVVRTAVGNDFATLPVDTPTTDWAANTLDISSGLKEAGAINALEWTNQQNGNTAHYFLAGTNTGLYAFVDTETNEGISVQAGTFEIGTSPFDGSYSWKKVEAIGNDPVVKIVSMYHTAAPVTFVITHGATHKIWRLTTAAKTTLTLLNDTVTLAWPADILNNTTNDPVFFYDMIPVANGTVSSTLLVATNQGLYIADDVTQDDAGDIAFSRLALSTDTNDIHSLSTPQRPIPDNTFTQDIYYVRQASEKTQAGNLSSTVGSLNFTAGGPWTYIQHLSSDSISTRNSTLAVPATIKSFYTDGARRFYLERIQNSATTGYTLHIAPFYPDKYAITEVDDLTDAAITSARTFYWINEMSAGYLMAGTDTGVIALQ